jgi:predicted house-cleaning noncanonical NTP pyrophosphatase (MazG superfamily)
MGKLVRDRIPELIAREGGSPRTRILDHASYELALRDKLIEEAHELRDADDSAAAIEEAADVYEVLLAIADRCGIGLEDIADRAALKRSARGGFDQRIWLES